MARITVDVELLMVGLLQAALGVEANVKARPDVDVADDLPLVIVTPVSGAMVANGAPDLGWSHLVEFTVLKSGHQDASDLADLVYQKLHGFHDSQAGLTGVGYINHTEDDEMFRRVATVIAVDNLTQYTGTFRFTIRPL